MGHLFQINMINYSFLVPVKYKRTIWNSNSNSPLIPWSLNLFLQYKSSIFCNVHLKWYISHSFKGWRPFMLWALTKIRSILGPYISDFLLTTTSFNPSWIIMNEMGCVFTQRKYSGHSGLKLCRLHITWQFFCTYWLEASFCSSLKTISRMWNFNIFSSLHLLLRLDRSVLLL